MSTGTPVWLGVLNPMVTLVGVVIAFLFGQVQGRSQARYVRSAEVLIELRRLVLEIEACATSLPEFEHSEEGSAKILEEMFKREAELVRYVETHELWLSRPVRDKVGSVMAQVILFANRGVPRERLGLPEPQKPLRLPEPLEAEAAELALEEQLHSLVIELAVETERLLEQFSKRMVPWLRRAGYIAFCTD
jgi:hypothetical protein